MKGHGGERGLRAIALIEAAKGMLVLFVACGLPWLAHHKARHFVDTLVQHFHLNPSHRTPQIFLKLAGDLDDAKLWWLAVGAVLYAVIRFVEAYGLWRARLWAEWLGCVGAGVYVPLELTHAIRHPGMASILVLVTNLIVVLYLALCLVRGVGRKRGADEAPLDSDV